jgi:hypothetical protein
MRTLLTIILPHSPRLFRTTVLLGPRPCATRLVGSTPRSCARQVTDGRHRATTTLARHSMTQYRNTSTRPASSQRTRLACIIRGSMMSTHPPHCPQHLPQPGIRHLVASRLRRHTFHPATCSGFIRRHQMGTAHRKKNLATMRFTRQIRHHRLYMRARSRRLGLCPDRLYQSLMHVAFRGRSTYRPCRSTCLVPGRSLTTPSIDPAPTMEIGPAPVRPFPNSVSIPQLVPLPPPLLPLSTLYI